jgi:DNA invertase Pin-like site-specific DNA recombinase
VAGVYKDNESGRKGRAEREAFDQMFTDASKGQFDLVLFWSLDCFSREGISQTIHYLRQLESYDVHFNSYTELSPENELVRSIRLSTLAYFRALRIGAHFRAHEGGPRPRQGER